MNGGQPFLILYLSPEEEGGALTLSLLTLSFSKLPNYKLQNTKLQSYKLQNCMCMLISFKSIKLKASQFKTIIITKIASTCLQICKITKLPKLQIASVFLHIYK
jgi:hypothetical protein